MRFSSLLFALLAGAALLGNSVSWMLGAPVRVTALFICATSFFVVLSVFLWRLRRWAAVVGLIVALPGLLLMTGAAYFLWPAVRASLEEPRVVLTTPLLIIFLPLLLTAAIAMALGRVLLSNQRLERP